MKKTFTILLLFSITLFTASAFIVRVNGLAGYTGSPGEPTCGAAGCHGGGSSPAKSVTISASPSFSAGEYLPDSIYTISVTVNATGFSKFGFGCEILNTSNTDIGTLQNAGSGVQFAYGFGKLNAIHTAPKAGTNSATFTFKWKAPAAGEGDATFYVCGNAVNGNNNTTGDLPILATPLTITEGVAVVQPTVDTGVNENKSDILSQVVVYPNPSSGSSNVSYSLKQAKTVTVELIDISGRVVKELLKEEETPGYHSHILNLHSIPSGVYFLKTSANGIRVSQKLITLN